MHVLEQMKYGPTWCGGCSLNLSESAHMEVSLRGKHTAWAVASLYLNANPPALTSCMPWTSY